MVTAITEEYNEIIKRAQEQPGIADLMQVYGHYEELLKQSYEYLANISPKIIISTTNTTS